MWFHICLLHLHLLHFEWVAWRPFQNLIRGVHFERIICEKVINTSGHSRFVEVLIYWSFIVKRTNLCFSSNYNIRSILKKKIPFHRVPFAAANTSTESSSAFTLSSVLAINRIIFSLPINIWWNVDYYYKFCVGACARNFWWYPVFLFI